MGLKQSYSAGSPPVAGAATTTRKYPLLQASSAQLEHSSTQQGLHSDLLDCKHGLHCELGLLTYGMEAEEAEEAHSRRNYVFCSSSGKYSELPSPYCLADRTKDSLPVESMQVCAA